MTPRRHYLIAGLLAFGGVVCLLLAVVVAKNITSHIDDTYQRVELAAGGKNYRCTGDPAQVADDLAAYKSPQARQADRGTEYLRYDDDIVTVGPLGGEPCVVHVEGLNAGYRGGAFVFLGPGFFPGAPSGGAGGSGGGPGGTK
ncbi:DUF4247 domain-containing protein [Tomitella fengzijianii]|uniref:DUF4247 domain-containing protein n=1 Tax=Tomitella fengzijianii TaxID=2597660 RepID=A0A516X2M8_9ACTN|nr:DUF4247 domain-containing protein [Tomitella fengzijianii]QDQ97332.1 DUF4247 domain-containing protein [Tomitella fengzijianii]